uniref:HEPN domain-containing protein n=1 Tax=mine drainage metagenome TaxID=410659 RepID=E6QVY9_9ZZZZ
MKKNVNFGKLVDNAFDFLDKAGREFKSEPKYSVIHFYAALELFLKARLLHESTFVT